MKLNAFTDYGLRVLMYLGAQPARRATIADIAAAFGVSAHHLTKVVNLLARIGWVTSVRGKGGGLELAMPPELIGVGDVVRAAEGEPLPAECFGEGGDQCRIGGACRLRGVLAEAVNAFYTALDAYTLADLLHNRAVLAGILFAPWGAGADRLGMRTGGVQ